MPSEQTQRWLVLSLALAMAPLVPHMPYWVSAFWAACALLRLAGRETLLAQWLRLAIAGVTVAGVIAEYRTVLGPQGGVALLVCMSALKLLETQTSRDRALMVLIGYFLLLANLIHDQGLVVAAYLFGVATLLTGVLVGLQPSTGIDRTAPFAIGARLMLQALPIAVIMFLLFPRIPSPFGGLTQVQTGRTGLSETMQPGSVSQLIESDEIAFRAEFEGPPPPRSELYWRGPVLWDFDGRSWRPAASLPTSRVDSHATRGRRVDYAVTLEPHRQRWLFTLGLPARPPDFPAQATADFQWLAHKPITERIHYRHSAFLEYEMDVRLAASARASALDLPAGYNPRARELVEGWLTQGHTDQALMRRALEYFREEPFYYTLRPPALGEHFVDDFLFDTRRGFCEHYASAFVVLMRLGGVPARVVTGYQGAERNALGDYWIVRQRDAHAWAEAWFPERGWLRVDPTAAVAPDRVERGIGAALPATERPVATWDSPFLHPLRQAWDLVNTRWNQWVIGYDHQRQRDFLSRLHPMLSTLRGMIWALLIGAAVMLSILFWGLRPRFERPRVDPAVRLYARFKARVRRAGLDTPANEGPLDLARRVARVRPDLASGARAIAVQYAALRYGGAPREDLSRLRTLLRAFKP